MKLTVKNRNILRFLEIFDYPAGVIREAIELLEEIDMRMRKDDSSVPN